MKKVIALGTGLIIALCIILFLKLSSSYTIKEAMENGDFITYPEEKNRDSFDNFIAKLQMKTDAKIRITEYSKEGEPRVNDLEYRNQVFLLHAFYPEKLFNKEEIKNNYNEVYFESIGEYKDMYLVNTNTGDKMYICQIR